jgi:hypothetical protein
MILIYLIIFIYLLSKVANLCQGSHVDKNIFLRLVMILEYLLIVLVRNELNNHINYYLIR